MRLWVLGLAMFMASGAQRVAHAYDPAGDGYFGVGVSLGRVFTVNAQLGTIRDQALVGGLGSDGDDLTLLLEYLWYFTRPRGILSRTQPFVGLGGALAFNDQDEVDDDSLDGYARVPVGLSWFPVTMPLNVYGQLVPNIEVEDGVAHLDGNLGFRYLF